MKIAIAQINPIVGDLEGNFNKIVNFTRLAYDKGADIVVFPEGVITGYPSQDLLFEKSFVYENKRLLFKAIENAPDIVAITGFVDYDSEGNLYNSAAVYKGNRLIRIVYKTLLPTYDVFDEERYFTPSKVEDIQPIPIPINGQEIHVGIEICEDLWDDDYEIKVTDLLAKRGADIIFNISASPFHVGKGYEREQLIKNKVSQIKIPFVYCNLVGGQDELVFDGQSLVINSIGNTIYYGKKFEEELAIVSLDLFGRQEDPISPPVYDREEELYNALVLGIRDYFKKTGFKKAIIGLSGGIDSSLVACLACDALGNHNVIGVSMPSKYSSDHSKQDARKLAENLGILYLQFSIQEIINMYEKTLEAPLKQIRDYFNIDVIDDNPVADENIQPRIRGNCLMDFSNRLSNLGILVLNTGNKTELALGYCTLYGDMTGGLIIPESVFQKKPSAELKENQFDPFNFDIVSPLVDEIIENNTSKFELLKMGYPKYEIDDVYRRIRLAEYKRWQAPPTIKITKKAFGTGWKMPIVNKYKGTYEGFNDRQHKI
ncbi:MAG: NAD(+) synthase [Candidatus Heimdallarchaeaceae archaeon]